MSGEESQRKVRAAAAFFDLDGTLIPKPSVERRFLGAMFAAGNISLWNCAEWVLEAMRLLPQGLKRATQGNKRYLRGVAAGQSYEIEGKTELWRLPRFFPQGVERAAWHARQGHAIVLVTGTLEPLAARAAAALREELKRRGCKVAVHVCATRLEENGGRWTGRIRGEAIFGEAKARAVRMMAGSFGLDLAKCSAYGDSEQDRWLLKSVGKAFVVNASPGLRRVARTHGWPVLEWAGEDRVRGNGVEAIRLCDGDAA